MTAIRGASPGGIARSGYSRGKKAVKNLGWIGAFPKGSVIQLDYLPGTGTQVWLNHRLAGSFAGEVFNRALLKIWLGDHPVQQSLKAALLGEQ